ncbi:MAG: cytochrome c biogenesis protein CcsA [Balneolaceae bacterium]
MWEEIVGRVLLSIAFLVTIATLILYGVTASRKGPERGRWLRLADRLWLVQGVLVLLSALLLVFLIVNHRFEFFYVWNYTSTDLETLYLVSALWGGQEGSFLVWIFTGFLTGWALLRWTREPYKAPVLFVMALSQVFLISMLLGWDVFGVHIGASPFRTIAQEMPNAPFIQANPDFVPAEGTGLNDLLQSPWMAIHPPIIFAGFAMMTVPFAFAIASLWEQKYHEWVQPAMPWTLGANLSLLTAIFLGGYWAYETLSFGGYWAWDPVENASLVPWLIGTAGIHMMIIQRKSSRAHKGAIFFAILAYIGVVYQTFLTRSGVLADQSVHSFVDLGLYNQLLLFMLVILFLGIGMYLWRYREIPSPDRESTILSAEFLTFTGGLLLFILGMVIILGTSSPIIGRLFVENPTPPEISFYNQWSMPIALIIGVVSVIGQHLFWKRHSWESLAATLITPLLISSVATLLSIVLGDVRDLVWMVYLYVAWFSVVGNGFMLIKLATQNARLIGGTLSHIGFGALLIGIMVSSIYSETLLDERIAGYNQRVEAGEVLDEQGFPVMEKAETFMLELNQPKRVGDRYMVTYQGYEITDSPRPGQQQYELLFEPINGGAPFTLNPDIYPMQTTSTRDRVEWAVEPHVRSGFTQDIYLYVAGSSYVDQVNERVRRAAESNADTSAVPEIQTFSFSRGETKQLGSWEIEFTDFAPANAEDLPENTLIGVRAQLQIRHLPTGDEFDMTPLFAVYSEEGESFIYSPPLQVERPYLGLRFTRILPDQDQVELTIEGLPEEIEEDWVVIVAETKPFVSVVWLGTFLLMIGFSVSILRHWDRERRHPDGSDPSS